MAHRYPLMTLLLLAAACEDGAGLPAPLDGGAAAPRDASVDAGQPAPTDAGPPPVRTVRTVDLLTPRAIANRLLLPDFEDQVINGGWLSLPVSPLPLTVPWSRRVDVDAPGSREEIATVPGSDVSSGGVGLYGFGAGTGQDLVGTVWLGLPEDASTRRWNQLEAGLIAFVEAQGPSVVFFAAEPGAETRALGRVWRRYAGRADARLEGRVVFGVQNLGRGDVWVTSPWLGLAPIEGAASASERPVPLSAVPRWRSAARRLGRGAD